MAGEIPLPRPRPSETDIFQAMADARQKAVMAQIAAMLTTARSAPPQGGQPLFADPKNPDDVVPGPMNITPQPIYYPSAVGFMGPSQGKR